MDATSPPVCPDVPYPKRLLLEAPILPYAAVALASTCLALRIWPAPLDDVWPWLLTVAGLCLCLVARGRWTPWAGRLAAVAGLAMAVGVDGRPPELAHLRAQSPVVVEGRVASHPRGRDDERWLWLRVDSVRQGPRGLQIGGGSFDVLVGLPEGRPPVPDMAPPTWGQRVQLRGYLTKSPKLDNGFAVRDPPWRLNLPSWQFWQVLEQPAGWEDVAGGLRAAASERLGCGQGPCSPGAELRRALLLGTPDGLPDRWRRALRATGLSHLLAVSGLHVGLVGGLVWLLAMPLGRRTRLLLSLAAVAAYLLLVGPKPSAVRAAGMGAVLVASACVGRPPQALNAAALWATILALWRPQILDDLGFQLSVAATLGILVLAPPIQHSLARISWLGRQPLGVRGGLAVCLAAQLSTLPLLAPWTGLVHPLGWCLNLLAIPWLTLFLGLSLLSLVPLSLGRGWIDAVLTGVLDLLTLPLEALATLPPSPAWTWPWLPTWSVACLVSALGLLCLLRPRVAARCAVVAMLLVLTGSTPRPVDRGYEFHRLDVGQGDAFLVRDGRHAVLVDGGGWRRGDIAARILVPALARRGVRRLDAVVMTHPDADHCHGMRDLLSYVAVEEVWSSPGWRDACATELVARRGPAWRPLWAGRSRSVGRWRVDVLWPTAELGPRARDRGGNDRSLVLRLLGGRQRILLTGDIGARVERRLVSRGDETENETDTPHATILGVPHHGSKTSTSAAFLLAVSPRLATIGVGARNAYGHPHPSVLGRLAGAGVLVHRTDTGGALDLRFRPPEVSAALE